MAYKGHWLDGLTKEEQAHEAYNLADEVEELKEKIKELKEIIRKYRVTETLNTQQKYLDTLKGE